MPEKKRVLIVGGVAGGASCAARLRRLDEEAEIILFDRGPHVSFANCGLPYYVGKIIKEESDLLVATPEMFKKNFNIEVRTENEVTRIDREKQEIEVSDLTSGKAYTERYDTLVLAPGASAIRPPLPGIDLPGIHILRTIPDSKRIMDWIADNHTERAVVVGGGFIGLEMAENLIHRGMKVTIVEMLDQLMPSLDREMAQPVTEHLESKMVNVELGDGVAAFEKAGDRTLIVKTQSGAAYPADIVILSIGVRPETKLARDAGIEIGEFGGIRVDETLRTNDPNIHAVGDVIEVKDVLTGRWCLAPLAGPANRQGRITAEVIAGRGSTFRGVQGTTVCGVLGLTLAVTGASEKRLKAAGRTDYKVVYVHPGATAMYYPGAKRMQLKLIFAEDDGLILGAQCVGEEGVDKRIDVLAMAIQKGATVYDLEEAELCYAPQFGSAKDPINIAGMVAANVLRGDLPQAEWPEVESTNAFLLDVRAPEEFARGHIDGAINIPLGELRDRFEELPPDREIWVNCAIGQRAYYATRFLLQQGFNVKHLSGGITTYYSYYP